MEQIDPLSFVEAVKPALAERNCQRLLETCKSRWSAEQIVSLLSCSCCDARKCAALALSLVGCPACLDPLFKQLKDADPMVNKMADNAIWSIWFRCGTPEANQQLKRGIEAVGQHQLKAAIDHFTKAIEITPLFAEAHNQRAIAFFLKEDFDCSIQDCRNAIELMPQHFGAWAGMGHCHAHEGRMSEAMKCYRRALEINPHLGGIHEAVGAVDACMDSFSR